MTVNLCCQTHADLHHRASTMAELIGRKLGSSKHAQPPQVSGYESADLVTVQGLQAL